MADVYNYYEDVTARSREVSGFIMADNTVLTEEERASYSQQLSRIVYEAYKNSEWEPMTKDASLGYIARIDTLYNEVKTISNNRTGLKQDNNTVDSGASPEEDNFTTQEPANNQPNDYAVLKEKIAAQEAEISSLKWRIEKLENSVIRVVLPTN